MNSIGCERERGRGKTRGKEGGVEEEEMGVGEGERGRPGGKEIEEERG